MTYCDVCHEFGICSILSKSINKDKAYIDGGEVLHAHKINLIFFKYLRLCPPPPIYLEISGFFIGSVYNENDPQVELQ